MFLRGNCSCVWRGSFLILNFGFLEAGTTAVHASPLQRPATLLGPKIPAQRSPSTHCPTNMDGTTYHIYNLLPSALLRLDFAAPHLASGLALACTLLAACCIMCRRRSTKKIKDLEGVEDVELGGSLDRTTPGRMNDSSSSDSRGFSSGQPVKTHTVGGGIGTPARISRGDSNGHMHRSPGRAMAMGENQRGRSMSRTPSRGPQMYSTTPGRHRGTSASPAGQGGAMIAVTPGGGSSGSRHGRQMYDQSGAPSWDEGVRGRMPSRSPGLVRPKSTGRMPRPPRSASQELPGGEYGRGGSNSGGGLGTMTPGRRRSSGGESRGSGHSRQESYGQRRSKSERYDHSPSPRWARQEEDGLEQQRWEDRDMMAAVGEIERGRRSLSHRSGRSSGSARLGSPHHHAALERSASGRTRGRSTTPSRQRGYNSEMVRSEGWFI